MGNIKISSHESNSCTKQEPASSSSTSEDHGPSTLIELNKIPSLPDLDTTPSLKTLTPVASLADLAPPNLNAFPDIKCEDDCNNNANHHHRDDDDDNNNDNNGDHANDHMQSPDYSLWESIFSDQLEGDFMVCSPVRNTSSYGNNHGPMSSSSPMHGNGVLEFSPPLFSSPRRNLHKGKGISPVQKVLNSPDNQFIRVDHVDSFALPALESLLVDDAAAASSSSSYYKDGHEDFAAMFSPMKVEQGGGGGADGSNDWFDAQAMVPGLLECLTLPDSARFGGSTLSDHGSSQMSQESGIYQAHTLPLSQQLREERMREAKQKQQERQQIQTSRMLGQPQQQQIHRQNQLHNMHSTLMVPMLEPEQETDSGLQLVHLLLACAEAVSKQDYMLARRYIYHLNRVVSPLGDSMQRVAACFTDALSERLASTLSSKPSSSRFKKFNPFPPDNLEILKIYQILYQACPYIKFAHFTANQAIYEAFECEERVHVIDLDILQGYQWPAFMQALAARPGGAPFLRITGVGPSPEAVIETGRCLTELAQSLHVPFEFHPVGEELEDLKPHMFNRRVGEALAVNSVNRLHRVPSNCLGNILAMIRDQAPNIVTIVEQEASHNGPYFLGRFLEALHYYSAIFDSLDATFPPESPQRSKVEQLIFAPEIRNIVAQEGPERVMRHERLERWRKVMEAKGFQCVPLSPNAVTQSTILLGLYSCDGYRLTEDKGCLLLGWQDRAILAASAWRC